MEDYGVNDLIDKEYKADDEVVANNEIRRIISNLQMYSDNVYQLTKLYTDILEDDNVVYIMTKISQNPIFMKHFPEFYTKNMNGESVINCQQNSPYHRYGVFKHILYTIENIGKDSLRYNSHDIKLLKWTMLLHDIGKPIAKTINSEGFDSFSGHDDISVELASGIIDRFDFDEQDKRIMLTLIKYHDRYLNEGDLTYDNLSFLAKELGDKKDLFYMLIEVKLADNRAKSIDVYNKFMTVVGKYYDFANEYFLNDEINKLFDIDMDSKTFGFDEDEFSKTNENFSKRGEYIEGGSSEDITEKIIIDLTRNITLGKSLKCYYQPIVDLKKNDVNGYEVFYKIITEEDFSYKQILRKAKEFGKYDKLQQMLFVNALERFNEVKGKQGIYEYINIDVKSYKNYVNKARIFDLIEENKVVFEFNNFESLINTEVKDLADEIVKRKGFVLMDNFESSKKELRDIEKIMPKFIKYKIEDTDDNTKERLQELSTFCMLNSINLIAFGVDSYEILELAKNAGVRYVQGEFFGRPMDGLELTSEKIISKITEYKEDLIV